jgi:hypothetical protein
MRRIVWVGAISLANALAAGMVATQVVRGAAGEGWGTLVPCAIAATLGLTIGGLWWGTRRQPRVRTGIGVGLAIGVLVHPVMWYVALLGAFVGGTQGSLADPTLTPMEGLTAVWAYAAISLLFTGWLSCSISAAICGAGLALYARQRRIP